MKAMDYLRMVCGWSKPILGPSVSRDEAPTPHRRPGEFTPEAVSLRKFFQPVVELLIEQQRDALAARAAERNEARVPGEMYIPPAAPRPMWSRLDYPGLKEARQTLTVAAKLLADSPAREPSTGELTAHGTQSADHFFQIMLDGELRHLNDRETYGSLGAGSEANTQVGGYWDYGWGVFVIASSVLEQVQQLKGNLWIVALEHVRAIVLPEPLVQTAQDVFPQWRAKITHHEKLASELAAEAR